MPIMTKPSTAPSVSLSFITAGVVLAIPAAVWYAMFDPQGVAKFFSASFFLLGLAFFIIGLSVGHIGRTARQAELPPSEAMGAAARQAQGVPTIPSVPPTTTAIHTG